MKKLIQFFSLLCILTGLHTEIATQQDTQSLPQISSKSLATIKQDRSSQKKTYQQANKIKNFYQNHPYLALGTVIAAAGITATAIYTYKQFSTVKDIETLLNDSSIFSEKDRKAFLEAKKDRNSTLLYWVVEKEYLEKTTKLLKKIYNRQKFELLQLQSNYQITPLHIAVIQQNDQMVETLLNGLSSDQKFELLQLQSNYQLTPLHIAVIQENNKMVQTLLNGLSKEQKLKLFRIQDIRTEKTLYNLASENLTENTIQSIKKDFSIEEETKLLLSQQQ